MAGTGEEHGVGVVLGESVALVGPKKYFTILGIAMEICIKKKVQYVPRIGDDVRPFSANSNSGIELGLARWGENTANGIGLGRLEVADSLLLRGRVPDPLRMPLPLRFALLLRMGPVMISAIQYYTSKEPENREQNCTQVLYENKN